MRGRLEELERVKGIGPSWSAWEAAALPLCYTRNERVYFNESIKKSQVYFKTNRFESVMVTLFIVLSSFFIFLFLKNRK